jgi:hypothetical protein
VIFSRHRRYRAGQDFHRFCRCDEQYQLAEGIEAVSVPDMAQRLLAKGRAA